jgi:hypothetical protein
MMMVIYSEFPLLGKMFSCLRCRVVTNSARVSPSQMASCATYALSCQAHLRPAHALLEYIL